MQYKIMNNRTDRAGWRIAIDVGGTFTDVVLVTSDGAVHASKSPSHPTDPAEGIMNALQAMAAGQHLSLGELLGRCDSVIHGSTVATNTVLEGKGASVGLLCTRGFRDTLTIRRGIRVNPWEHRAPHPEPMVPRYRRRPVAGRIDAGGLEIEPLGMRDVEAGLAFLLETGIEALAISFLHAYANNAHEVAARALVSALAPDLPVFISSEIAPLIGEYVRTSSTVTAAYVSKRVVPYLTSLSRSLAGAGLHGRLHVMQSNGGLITLDEVARNPALLLLSGPAGGVGALRWIAEATERKRLITMEMGGTSCDLILFHDGHVDRTDALEVAGYHISIPSVDIHTVSAGGGSIARVDQGGVLTLGPDGAGSTPGPAAYGRGGRLATDTDAQLVLGRLAPGPFAGGAIHLDGGRAYAVVHDTVAAALKIDASKSADGIVRLQQQNLVHAVERVSIERGFDPRDFTLVAVGGAAALHAGSVARALGCSEVIIPRLAGVFCAFGMLYAPIRRDHVRTLSLQLEAATMPQLLRAMDDLQDDVREALRRQDLDVSKATFEKAIDLNYAGQQSAITVAFEGSAMEIRERFLSLHNALYGHVQKGSNPQLSAIRVAGLLAPPPVPVRIRRATAALAPAPRLRRDVWIGDRTQLGVPVFDGATLQPGHVIEGPCVIEEATTTILLEKGDRATIDLHDNYIVSTIAAAASSDRAVEAIA
ncbi:hydantoinase/oxoprolinase family protein [Mesorhizobium sp.]|uniref:hydantoinase/oxoprolinase family protein n=1 Tax=Mesorhizobium sp. TaxID=1871066 RepID=UPI002681D731